VTMPKLIRIEIKKTNTWMGTVYRIYIDGMYMGASATRATAKEAAKRATYDCVDDLMH
jgi:hypothetical protein